MATHILDILGAIDVELESRQPTVGDLAESLHRSGRTMQELVATGVDVGAPNDRRKEALAMADACIVAGGIWPAAPGRCAQLVGLLGDITGRLHDELTQSDRWATVIAISSVARRCARLIAATGPYDHVAELSAVRESSARLRRVAEVSPPDPSRCIGLTRPIPTLGLPPGLAPGQVAYESMAEILDLLNRREREAVSLPQIIAACRAAEAIAEALRPPSSTAEASTSAARAWRTTRIGLSRLTDGSRAAVSNDRVLLCAARVVQGMEMAPTLGSADGDKGDRTAVERVAALLPVLADTLDRELRRMTRPPIGLVADRPLHEGRVSEWLHRRAFLATREEAAACRAPVEEARKRSEEFTIPFELSL